jgi:hypothetical protein
VGLPVINGILYTSLDWIVTLAGGVVRRLGNEAFVESDPARLTELEVTEDRVVLRLDAFVPVELLSSDGSAFRLRLHHAKSSFPHRSFVLADGPMTRVDAQAGPASTLEIRVSLREPGALRLTRFESPDAYAVTIEIGEEPWTEAITVIEDDRRLHELVVPSQAGSSSLTYMHVEGWRSTYRIVPCASAFDLGDPASILTLAQEGGAESAIAASDNLALLVVDGVPLSVPCESSEILTADAFGRLSSIDGVGRIVLRVEGEEIGIDDVNRPIRYGEAIAYPPGYRSVISGGTTGGFTVLKLRSGHVVSVYNGSFVDEDPTTTLVVASGEARSRFDDITVGDDARLACYVGAGAEALANALTVECTLLEGGVIVDSAVLLATEDPRPWSIIATDEHGSLILLSFARNERSAGATAAEVMDVLASFDVPIRDAFVLKAGPSSTIVVRDRGLHALGDVDRVAAALLLVPIDE